MRIGMGYDVHKLVKNRKLFLGGIEIPHKFGLLGHSDADVLLHALIDALLGAMGEGSIGKHFPPTDNQYKGISSLSLLKKVKELLEDNKFNINNLDCVIVCEEPKIEPYVLKMKQKIAEVLQITIEQINIKGKTEEGLGFTGQKKGISSYAVCLLHHKV